MGEYDYKEPTKIFTQNPKGNRIYKYREDGGAWVYRIDGKDGEPIAFIRFGGRSEEHRVTNADLLEIVKDRLHALRGKGTTRSRYSEQHVTEALLWATAPVQKKVDGEEETEKDGE